MHTELFYLLGALRDASIDVRRGKNYELRIYQSCEPWLEYVAHVLADHFGVRPGIRNNLLRLSNKRVIEELLEISEYRCPQDTWETPSVVRRASTDELWWYTSGFWDAEGGLPWNPEATAQRYVSFDQKCREAVEFLRNFLVSEGFLPSNLSYTGQVWQFRINRREHIRHFAHRLHSQHRDKHERLTRLARVSSP